MKQNVTEQMFINGFPECHKDNFSYAGKKALYDYLTDFEECDGEELEFDPIALCCEYSEYTTAREAYDDYCSSTGHKDLSEDKALEWLYDNTDVIQFDDNTVDGRGVIIRQF